MTSDDTRLCFHIDVPELVDQLGSAALGFPMEGRILTNHLSSS